MPQTTEPARAGTSDALAILFALTFPTVATWLYFVLLSSRPEAMRLTYAGCKVVQFAFPAVWVWLVQRRRIRYPGQGKRGVVPGVLFALVVVAGLLTGYYSYFKTSRYLAAAPELLWQKIHGLGCETAVEFWLLAGFLTGVHSLLEEYYWRWFVFGQLRRYVPVAAALGLSSLAFAAHHWIVVAAYLKPEHVWTVGLFFALSVAAGGGVWAWLYHRSGSLLGPWLSHLLIDAGIMWIGFDLCRERMA